MLFITIQYCIRTVCLSPGAPGVSQGEPQCSPPSLPRGQPAPAAAGGLKGQGYPNFPNHCLLCGSVSLSYNIFSTHTLCIALSNLSLSHTLSTMHTHTLSLSLSSSLQLSLPHPLLLLFLSLIPTASNLHGHVPHTLSENTGQCLSCKLQ